MAEEKKTEENKNSTGSQASGGIMFIGLRFIIFFGLSFFILSLPYNKRPIFYYLHQTTSKIILTLTGTDYYKPTFPVTQESIQQNIDKTKTQFSAPVK